MRRSRALLIAVVLTSALAVLTACGSSGPSRPSSGQDTDSGGGGSWWDQPDVVDVGQPADTPTPPRDEGTPPPQDVVDTAQPDVLPDTVGDTAADTVDDAGDVSDTVDPTDVVNPDVADVPVQPDTVEPLDVPVDTPEPADVGEVRLCLADLTCVGWGPAELPPCQEVRCDVDNRMCAVMPLADGEICDDGDACTEEDACVSGVCEGTTKTCDDENVCNGLETCDAETGDCLPGENLDCAAGDRCKEWTCDPVNGCFEGDPIQCNTDPCFGTEHCVNSDVGCERYAPPLCPIDDPCLGTLIGCDALAVGAGHLEECWYEGRVECDDDDVCNGVFECEATEDGGTECVEVEPALVCDDENDCNGRETCDPVDGCLDGPPIACNDDGLACNGIEQCDPEVGHCVAVDPCPDDDDDICNGTQECRRVVGVNAYECDPVPALDCEDGDPCNGTQTCDPEFGCVDDAPPPDCDNGDPCDGEESCNPIDGSCVPGEALICDDGDDCNGIRGCQEGAGCVELVPAMDCQDDDVCNGTETCENSQCQAGEPLVCNDHDRCNGVEYCDSIAGCLIDPLQGPVPPCDDNNVCNGISTCNPTTGACQPGEPLDCQDGNPCTQDSCHSVNGCGHAALADGTICDDDDPCTLDDVCLTGACVPTHVACLCPADDDREPDDGTTRATFTDPERDVTSRLSWDGVVCGNNQDWWELNARQGDRFVADLRHDAAYGNLDLKLRDAAGTLLAISATDGDLESIEYTAPEHGPVYLVVSGPGVVGFENSYTLDLVFVPRGVCLEDAFETNDSLGTATETLPDTPLDARTCPGNPDWYQVVAEAETTVVVDLVYDPPETPVTLELLDAAGTAIEVGTGPAGRQRVQLDVTEARTLYARVTVVDGNEANYTVTVRAVSAGGCLDDFYEENDEQSSAVELTWGDELDAQLCAGEADWYAIELRPGDEIQVDLLSSPVTTNLNVYVHRPISAGGGWVAPGLTPDGEEHVFYTVPAGAVSGLWGIRVIGVGSATAAYTLSVSGSGGQVTCSDDLFEPNDAPGDGPMLAGEQNLAGRVCPNDEDWYQVQLSEGDTLAVDLQFTHADGDLTLVVQDPFGVETGRSETDTDDESLSYAATTTGTYRIGVFGAADVENAYTLGVAVDYLNPACVDDAREENDSPDVASAIASDLAIDLVSCPGDDDWFVFELGAGETANVVVASAGDLGCSLRDPADNEIATCLPGADGATATVQDYAGPVRVLVTATSGDVAVPYALTLSIDAPPACEDDGREDDDELLEATALTNGVMESGVRCPGDDDWFTIPVEAGQALQITLDSSAGPGDLSLVVWGLQGEPFVVLDESPTIETMNAVMPETGTYGLQVTGAPSGTAPYTLVATVGAFVCTADAWEPNETQDAAVPVGPDFVIPGQLCDGDVDWFQIDLFAGEQLRWEMLFDPTIAELKAHLHAPDGTEEMVSTPNGDFEVIVYDVPADGTYGVRIASVSGGENAFFVLPTIRPYVPPCEDDAFEDDDGPGTAVIIDLPGPERTTAVTRQLCDGDEDWFALDVPGGDRVQAELTYDASGGLLYLELVVGDAVVESVLGQDGHALIEHLAGAPDIYYVKVRGEAPDIRAPYELGLGLDTPYICPEDEHEENDAQSTATAVAYDAETPGHSCPGDDDWFSVVADTRDEVTVTLHYTAADGDLDLSVVAEDGTTFDSATTQTDDETLTFDAIMAGTYAFRVFGANSEVDNDYVLTVTRTTYTCVEDTHEENDTLLQAVEIARGGSVDAVLCAGEDDWFGLILNAGEGLSVTLEYEEMWGHPQIAIVSEDGVPIDSTQGEGGSVTLEHTAGTAGIYYFHVWGSAELNTDYTLSTSVQPYTCENDNYEPSGADSPANVPVSGVLPGGMICVGDEDWYRVPVAPGDTVIASLSLVHADGDLSLELIRPDGTVAATSATELDFESASAQSLVAGDWIVRVYGATPGVDNAYDLTVSVLAYQCEDDGFEDNDSQMMAAPLLSGVATDGLMCMGDDDWFGIPMLACQTLTVEMTSPYAEDTNLQLALHTPSGERVGSSRSETDVERIIYRAPEDGTYAIRIYAEVAAESSYSLTAVVAPAACEDDLYEDNDTQDTPYVVDVVGTARPGRWHCCNDDDWFEVYLDAGERLQATLCHDTPTGDLDLSIYDANGDLYAASETDKAEHVTLVATEAGTWRVGVTAARGVQNDYWLWLTRDAYVCTDDGYEENDGGDTAWLVTVPEGGEATLDGGVLCSGNDDWYAVVLEAGDTLGVDVRFDQPEMCPADDTQPTLAGHDVNVKLYAPDGTPVGMGTSTTSDEFVEVFAPQGGLYRVEITSPVFADQTYSATFGRTPFVCAPDAHEENDEKQFARELDPAAPPLEGTYCNDDHDWYWFRASNGDTVRVDLLFPTGIGALHLAMEDPTGSPIPVTTSGEAGETIQFDALESGRYYVHVSGEPFAENRYQLAVDVTQFVCVDDANEPNNRRIDATILTSAQPVLGQVCPFDVDYYFMYLAAGNELTVDLLFTHAFGDLNLVLLRSDGTQIEASETVDNNERIVFEAPQDGTYYVRVEGVAGSFNAYELTATRVECRNDDLEPNDIQTDALDPSRTDLELGDGTSHELRYCPHEYDWFRTRLAAGDILSVDIMFIDDESDLQLYVYDPNDLTTPLASGTTTTNDEHIQFTAPASGTYLVLVYSDTPPWPANYRIDSAVDGAGPGCIEDVYEENDTQEQSVAWPVGVPTLGANMCGLDEDWFSLDLTGRTGPTAIQTDLTYLSGNGDLAVSLLHDGTTLDEAATAGGTGTVSASLPLVLPDPLSPYYYVRVRATSGTENAYELTTTITDWQCTEEAAETEGDGNDTLETADDFPLGQTLEGSICPENEDWYSFYLPLNEDVWIELTFTQYDTATPPSYSNLKMYLYDETGATIRSNLQYTSTKVIRYRFNPTAGTYFLRVYGDAVAANAYELFIEIQ